jgi:hypothetical protein
MRFILLVAGAAATGALVEGAVLPRTAQTFEVAKALGGQMDSFQIGEINPIRAYRDFMRQVASGELGRGLSLPNSPALRGSPIDLNNFKPAFVIDDQAIQRTFASSMNDRFQQDARRARNLAAYSRNPNWRGFPPY